MTKIAQIESERPHRRERSELSDITREVTRSTSRLEKAMAAIRDGHATQPGTGYHLCSTSGIADDQLLSRRRDYVDPKMTLEYPAQGKLQTPVTDAQDGYTDWEPAESLYIAIIVGPDELGSGMLRNQFTTLRRQRHDAMVFRWQGDFTLDLIGFDAIDHEADRQAGRVDLVLLSDQIMGPCMGGESVRELERVAVQTRIKLHDSYLVAVSPDPRRAGMTGHPFTNVESKARAQGLPVFDAHLDGEVSQAEISQLLIQYAQSPRYASDRSVWITPELDGVPLPICKKDA